MADSPRSANAVPSPPVPGEEGLEALALWLAQGGRSAAHRFALDRFWALRLGLVAQELVYEPWEVLESGHREPRLVAPVFNVQAISPSSPSLSFLAAIPKVEKFCPIDIDDLGNFWFRSALQAFSKKEDEARAQRRNHQVGGAVILPPITAYIAEVEALTNRVPARMQDDWKSLQRLVPANELAEKARKATCLLLQSCFDRSVFGPTEESRAFLTDNEAFVIGVFNSLRKH